MSTPGNKLTAAVIKKLENAGIFCWRQNNLPVYDPKLNNGYGGYRSHSGLKGVPDVICIIKGQFVGIEIKAGKDRLSAHQVLFQQRCEYNGGKYMVVKKISDINSLLACKKPT